MHCPWLLNTGELNRCQPPFLHWSLFTGGPVIGSQLSPVPSRSKSSWLGLNVSGQLSSPSRTPSLSSSESQLSPTPSLSVSVWSAFETEGQLSLVSATPSPSASGQP